MHRGKILRLLCTLFISIGLIVLYVAKSLTAFEDFGSRGGRGPTMVGRIFESLAAAFASLILERSLDLFDCVRLDNVADLHIIVSVDVKTAVHTHVYFLDIVFEAFE